MKQVNSTGGDSQKIGMEERELQESAEKPEIDRKRKAGNFYSPKGSIGLKIASL